MSCNTNQIEELVKKIVAEYNTTGAKHRRVWLWNF